MPEAQAASPAPAAVPAAVAAESTLATTEFAAAVSTDGPAAEAAAASEAVRVAALTPEARDAEAAVTAKTKADATQKAQDEATEKARRDALTPQAKKAEDAARALAEANTEAARHAPEKYDYVLPEGAVLDPESTSAFETIAREADMPQAVAQKIVDLNLKIQKEGQAKQAQQVAALQQSWRTALEKDPDFGPDKATFDKNAAIAVKAMKFAPPGLKEFLNETRLGNHPLLVKWMLNTSRAMAEDGTHNGSRPTSRDESEEARARRLYPNQS